MFNILLKNLSILKKFLFINLIIFIIIGSFTIIYLSSVKPNLIKKKNIKSYSNNRQYNRSYSEIKYKI